MLHAKHLGRIALPRGALASVIAERPTQWLIEMGRREICQHEVERSDTLAELKQRVETMLGRTFEDVELERGVLWYRSVSSHVDDWTPACFSGRRYAPYFLHIVLQGRGSLLVGKTQLDVRRGDVFIHSPNVKHAFKVRSSRPCCSACFTVSHHAAG